MFEKISDPIISTKCFFKRLSKHGFYVLGFLGLSLVLGAFGFMLIEGVSFKDAILFSSHIHAGLGPLQMPESYTGQMYIALLKLYSNLFFVAAFSAIAAPIVHRILHKMHLEDEK